MTKYDYLSRLKRYLQPLPAKERNAAIRYYDKYFTDAGPENEQNVILSLGSPKVLADRIISKDPHSFSGMMNATKNNVKKAQDKMDASQRKMSCFFAIVLFPVWGGIIFLFLLALLFFALCVAGALLLSAFGGIALLCMSFPYISNLTSVGMVLIGISLILISLPILLFFPAMNFVMFVIKKSVAKFISLFNNLLSGKAVFSR